MNRQQLEPSELRWVGQRVLRLDAPLGELEALLPTFSQKPLTHGHALNEYLDMIVRNPIPTDDREVPIATVSKRYALIQHQDAVRCIVLAFESKNWMASKRHAEAWMSDYGERLRVAVSLPGETVDPGDGYPLRAEVLLWNSVDRSRAFEIAIRWKRLICKNGLTIFDEDRLRKIHNIDWMAAASPVQFLTDCLPASRNRVLDLVRWLDVPLEMAKLIHWADNEVTARWGISRSARLIHILRTGHDCS
jgi:hypothetical protein